MENASVKTYFTLYINKVNSKTGFRLQQSFNEKRKKFHTGQVHKGTVLSTKSYVAFILKFMCRIPYPIPLKIWGKNGEQRTEIQLTQNKKGKGVTLKFGLN